MVKITLIMFSAVLYKKCFQMVSSGKLAGQVCLMFSHFSTLPHWILLQSFWLFLLHSEKL